MNLGNQNFKDLPVGFGLALAQNLNALDKFSSMTNEKQKEIVEGAKQVSSKKEMRSYVDNIPHAF